MLRPTPARSLEPETRLLLAEARLRSGALDEALAEFERVLGSSSDPLVRASALARATSISRRISSVRPHSNHSKAREL